MTAQRQNLVFRNVGLTAIAFAAYLAAMIYGGVLLSRCGFDAPEFPSDPRVLLIALMAGAAVASIGLVPLASHLRGSRVARAANIASFAYAIHCANAVAVSGLPSHPAGLGYLLALGLLPSILVGVVQSGIAEREIAAYQ